MSSVRVGRHFDMKTVFSTELAQLHVSAVQSFISSKVSAAASVLTESKREQFRRIKRSKKLYAVAHGKYIYNLCQLDRDWQIAALVGELKTADSLGSDLIIHTGNCLKLERKVAAVTFVRQISDVLSAHPELRNILILENAAGKGSELCSSLVELAAVWNSFDATIRQRLGICLDTCHLWDAGELRFSNVIEVDNFLKKFDKMIGLQYIKVIHINDSMYPFGSKRDIHANILHGYITDPTKGGNRVGFAYFCHVATRLGVPLILETPMKENWSDEVKMVQCWAAGGPWIF